MLQIKQLAIALGVFLGVVSASTTVSCSADQKCPESTPCCSAYGVCGVGAYCLGGCDPKFSYDLNSCVARPTCKSENYNLNSLDDVQQNYVYLGDASKVNWVAQGTPVVYQDDSILLTMAQDTAGTLLSSAHYVWYGKIAVKMKTSAGQGVVTAFVMMSDVKDEIDFEFIGADLQSVQSNFYWQGTLNYTNEKNLTVANTNTEWHTYEYDWQPESLTWSIDGNVMRTLNRDDTYNSTTDTYEFPQTPARIQLSLWPAGSPKNAPGVITWAGGLINWNSPYMSNGYYYAQVESVDVTCYDPPSGANVTGSESYVYNNLAGLENNVAITNENTILGSFYATGDDEDYNPHPSHSASASASGKTATAVATSSQAAPTNTDVPTVPGGMTGSGGGGGPGDGTTGSGGSGGPGAGSGSTGGGDGNGSGSTGSGGFSQGTQNSNMATNGKREQAAQGSLLAVVVALIGLVAL